MSLVHYPLVPRFSVLSMMSMPMPLLSHAEITRVCFKRIMQVLEASTQQARLRLTSFLVQEAPLQVSQALALCTLEGRARSHQAVPGLLTLRFVRHCGVN